MSRINQELDIRRQVWIKHGRVRLPEWEYYKEADSLERISVTIHLQFTAIIPSLEIDGMCQAPNCTTLVFPIFMNRSVRLRKMT